MADYCGEYNRGFDTGNQRAAVLGDFLEDLEAVEAELGPGMAVSLGICEGHGTGVKVGRDPEGTFWFVQVPLGPRKPTGMPAREEIPPPPHEATVLPAKGELEALVLGFIEHADAAPRGAAPRRRAMEVCRAVPTLRVQAGAAAP